MIDEPLILINKSYKVVFEVSFIEGKPVKVNIGKNE